MKRLRNKPYTGIAPAIGHERTRRLTSGFHGGCETKTEGESVRQPKKRKVKR